MPKRSPRTGLPRKPVTTKLAVELIEALFASAEQNGRSLGYEIEYRLRGSFSAPDLRTLIREEIRAALAERNDGYLGQRPITVPPTQMPYRY